MKPENLWKDNITEVLIRIIDFTEKRRDILTRNIFDCHQQGFLPQDLPEAEFAHQMTQAISEHMRSNRLIFCDSDHIHFGAGRSFEITPVLDADSQKLLQRNLKDYLKHQIQKLSENLLNNRIATELLRHQQQRSLQSVPETAKVNPSAI